MVNEVLEFKLVGENASAVEYEYYPEGDKKAKGLVSFSKKDGRPVIIELSPSDDMKMYAGMLFKRLRQFHETNAYKAQGKVIWY